MKTFIVTLLCVLAASALAEIDSKIVGGSNADANEFPWQGSIQTISGSSWFHVCGCVLYFHNKAVTAAHCLTSGASSYRIAFGMRRMIDADGTEQYSSVISYTNHPEWNGNAPGYPNDIAVIRLTSSMDTTSPAVGTIPLASGSQDYTGHWCVISGWGRLTGGGSSPNFLQKTNMTVLSNADCLNRWSGIQGTDVNDGHVCVLEAGKSICAGDSGGPLVCGNTLVGITSWSLLSCADSHPSVYSRVSHFYSWISDQ